MNTDIDLKLLTKEYLKSYYSINSYIGCTINCGYCFLAPIKIVPMRPIKAIDEEELIDNMVNDKYFKEHETVLSLNNRTDPFISPEVKASTFKLMDIMEEKGLNNIVTITTKGLLTKEDAEKLDQYKNIKVVIIVTYNNLPLKIQPIKKEIQEETMKNISACNNVILLHQFRPIIPGLNDDEETIRKTVNYAKQFCNATIYQGIRVNQYIKDRLEERDYTYNGEFDTHKQKSKDTDSVFEKLKEEDESYQIFDHTSCALSYIFEKPDYNMHYSKIDCSKYCKNYDRCHSEKFSIPKNLEQELERIGIKEQWKIENETLMIKGSLNDEQKSYIKHILHLKVKSSKRENTYSEKIMEG